MSGDHSMLGAVDLRAHVLSAARRGRLVVAAFVLASLATLALVPAATATSPCATKVLADWYDNGRIDGRYALPCYEEAIDAVPSDVRDYSSAQEVIARALQEVARELGVSAHRLDGPRTPSVIQNPAPTPVPPVETAAPTSIPIPLVVLGSLSVVLLLAGSFGYILRRRRDAGADGPDAG